MPFKAINQAGKIKTHIYTAKWWFQAFVILPLLFFLILGLCPWRWSHLDLHKILPGTGSGTSTGSLPSVGSWSLRQEWIGLGARCWGTWSSKLKKISIIERVVFPQEESSIRIWDFIFIDSFALFLLEHVICMFGGFWKGWNHQEHYLHPPFQCWAPEALKAFTRRDEVWRGHVPWRQLGWLEGCI